MEDYKKFSGEVSRYEANASDWERECREIEIKSIPKEAAESIYDQYLEIQILNGRVKLDIDKKENITYRVPSQLDDNAVK